MCVVLIVAPDVYIPAHTTTPAPPLLALTHSSLSLISPGGGVAFSRLQGKVYYKLPGYSEEDTKAIYEQLLYLLCSPGHIGTMFQATSTNDITFWVLHPTVDRYVQQRLLALRVLRPSLSLSLSLSLSSRPSLPLALSRSLSPSRPLHSLPSRTIFSLALSGRT